MSSSDFYRRQAEEMMRRAEMAEVIEKVSELPEGSVITFVKDTYTYGAVSVRMNGTNGEVRWFLTGTVRRDSYRVNEFIQFLVSHRVENINVWMDAVPLDQWPAKDVVVDVTPEDNDK